jgi:hypothetical protein
MYTVPLVGWIANAAARLMGPHGAVTEQAQKSGCSRQSVYDHAQKVKAAVEGEHGGGPMRAELVEENKFADRKTPNGGTGSFTPSSFLWPSCRSSP